MSPRSFRRLSLVTLAALLLLAGRATGARAQEAEPVLRPGDIVRITVLETPSLSGDFTIGADSTLIHPRYIKLRLGGLPLSAVRPQVDAFLKQLQREPLFTVEPLLKVSIGGEVRSPSVYTLPPETSISEAITKAGGPTSGTNLKHVRLVREGATRTLDLSRLDGPEVALTIRSGDQIVVTMPKNALRSAWGPISSVLILALSAANLLRR